MPGYLSVREMPYAEFADKTAKLINEGVSIAAFPEGTRSRDKSVGQFHSAIFRTALATHAAIVPVCITGNENVPPIGSGFLRPGLVKIHRLPALTWNEYGTFSAFKLKNYCRDMIAQEVLIMDTESRPAGGKTDKGKMLSVRRKCRIHGNDGLCQRIAEGWQQKPRSH